jgi:hypothetical protein
VNYLLPSQAAENCIRVVLNSLKICGDIRKSRCTGITGGKFTAGVVNTGGKFASVLSAPAANSAGVVDSEGKFATDW